MESSFEIPDEVSQQESPMKVLEINLTSPKPVQIVFFDTNISTIPYQNTSQRTTDMKLPFSSSIEKEDDVPIKQWNYINTLDISESSSENEDLELPTYKKILLAEVSSEKLIAKFCAENSRLLSSDASDKEFSFRDCVKRLKEGYNIYMVDYLTKKLKAVHLTITDKELLITHKRNIIRSPFSKLKGILVGNSSSSFKIYSESNAEPGDFVYEETDCMSILGEFRSFDIISKSPLARYDIYIGLSWYIAGACPKTNIIPLSKSRLTLHLIRMKIYKEADSKSLFFKELILLGIMKHLINSKASQKKKMVVKALLDKKFRLPEKVFRISYKMRPQSFRMSDSFKEKYSDTMRIRELMARMAFNIKETAKPTVGNILLIERKATLKEDILKFNDIGSIKKVANSLMDRGLLNLLNESIRSRRSPNETNN